MKWPRIEPGADQDIEQAIAYLAPSGIAIQAAFAKSLKNALWQIARTPGRFARLETNETQRDIRRAILWRFNYLIIYELTDDAPVVLAVMHASRQPDYWLTREDS